MVKGTLLSLSIPLSRNHCTRKISLLYHPCAHRNILSQLSMPLMQDLQGLCNCISSHCNRTLKTFVLRAVDVILCAIHIRGYQKSRPLQLLRTTQFLVLLLYCTCKALAIASCTSV